MSRSSIVRTIAIAALAINANLALTTSAEAATIYVAKSGANSSSCGSASAPCASISYAVDSRISGGDEVIVRAGTYREIVTVREGGSANSPTWVHAYPGEKVFIDASGMNVGDGIVNAYADYVRIEGFEIANASSGWELSAITIMCR